MAEEPENLIRLEEEIEGDNKGTGDFIFRRIGESVPLKPSDSSFDLESPPVKPLAVSDRLGLLFLAHSQGFLVAKTVDVIGLAEEIKEKGKGPSVQPSCVVDVLIGRVAILALSQDSSMLAATVGGDIHFFSVALLLNKVQEPSFSSSLNQSSNVKDVQWQKNAEKSFVVLLSDGSLYHGNPGDSLRDVMDNVDAVDWSIEGDSIAIARKNTLSILSSNFKEQLHMSLLFQSWSNYIDSECLIKVDSIKWVRDDSIIVGCIVVNEDGKQEDYLVQVITSKEHGFTEASCRPVVLSFPNLSENIAHDILPYGGGPYLLVSYLDRWELALASNKKNIDEHIMLLGWSLDDNQKEVVSLELQNEKYTPRIDLQENGDDNLILGIGVDKISLYGKVEIQVDSEFKELSPYCILLCLTSEGKLIMYHAARISESSVLPQTPVLSHDDNVGVEERVPLENELPSSTSRLKDYGEDLVSDVRLRKISTETPKVGTGKELKSLGNHTIEVEREDKQISAGPALGIHTGQISKLDQFPVESPHIQESDSALRNFLRPCIGELKLSSARGGINSTSLVSNMPSETSATRQSSTSNFLISGLVDKGSIGSTSSQEASFGSQSTAKVYVADGYNAEFSSSASSRPIFGGAQENTGIGTGKRSSFPMTNSSSADSLSGGQLFRSKGSTASAVALMSINTAAQNEGHKISWTSAGNAVSASTIRGSPVMPQEGSVLGKTLSSKPQALLDNIKTFKSPELLDSESELSKHFYNVKDMTKELDTLLSFIEQEGGFRDTCTVFQKTSLSALEEGLEDLSEMSRTCKNKIEEQLAEIRQLQNTMVQVSAKQAYMEGIVKQASNKQYWDVWNRQKLSPELELKRQRMLKAHQNLTNQLVELEKHFNTLEINRFGESNRSPAGRRAFHSSVEPSRQIQSLHSVFNTLNSQLAAAEQLSECLSHQMAALNINSSSTKRMSIAKELFESIGLAHEANSFQAPDLKKPGLTPESTKRIPLPLTDSANKEYPRRNMSSVLKDSKPKSARRGSLGRSWDNFEPQKVTVKRVLQDKQVSTNANKPFRATTEAFDYQDRSVVQHTSNENLAPSQPSHAHSPSKGIQEKPSKQAFRSQSNSIFKWTKDLSESSRILEPKSHHMQVMQSTYQSSSSVTPSPSLYSEAQNIAKMNSGLPIMSSIGVTHVGRQADSSAIKTVGISKTISDMQSETSTANQTSSKFPSSISPMKSTVPLKAVQDRAIEQLNMKGGEDSLTRSSPKGMNQGAVTPEIPYAVFNESSISSLSTMSAVPSTSLNGNTAQVDRITSKHQSSETVSTIASLPTGSISSPPLLPVLSSASPTSSIVSAFAAPASLPTMAFGGSSLDSKIGAEANPTASVSSSAMVASNQSHLSSSSPAFENQKSYVSPLLSPVSESAATHSLSSGLNEASSISETASLQAPASEILGHRIEVSSRSERTSSEAPTNEALVGFASKGEVNLLSTSTANIFPGASNFLPVIPLATTPLSNSTTTEKDEGLDLIVSQEDEMEEEAPDTTTMLNLGALSGFGFNQTVPSSAPKSNPFGGSFGAAPSTAISPHPLTASPGELFRPASFSLPSVQPVQPSQTVNSGPFSGGLSGGFSGFGQPAHIGSGQQALGSVLGAFGQSRQLGAGAQGIGFASPGGFGASGFSASANSGGGFPSSGGFAGAAMGGGFTSVASSGGGFAGAAMGGGFTSVASSGGGFAGAAVGGGFSAVAPSGGGFAAAASAGGGFGGAGSGGGSAIGGFGAFRGNQGSGFSAFGASNFTGAGKPPAELLTQMRK